MKAIVDYIHYNTKVAVLVDLWSNDTIPKDSDFVLEKIYRTKHGRWFVHGCGFGTAYRDYHPDNSVAWGERIVPLTKDEALAWLREKSDAAAIFRFFGPDPTKGDTIPDKHAFTLSALRDQLTIHGVEGQDLLLKIDGDAFPDGQADDRWCANATDQTGETAHIYWTQLASFAALCKEAERDDVMVDEGEACDWDRPTHVDSAHGRLELA